MEGVREGGAVLERCALKSCERRVGGGGGGGGGGGLLASVCLGIIYQIYCFLVLLPSAIGPSPGPPASGKPRQHPPLLQNPHHGEAIRSSAGAIKKSAAPGELMKGVTFCL